MSVTWYRRFMTVHLLDTRHDYKPRPRATHAPPAAFAPSWPRVVSHPSERWIVDDRPFVEVRDVAVGGFETQATADDWKRAVDAHPKKVLTTAGDLLLGKWSGEIRLLVPCMYNGWRWGEIWDIGRHTDNGHVLFCSVRDRWVHPDTVVLLDDAARHGPNPDNSENLSVSEAPPLVELAEEHIPYRHSLTRHPKGGHMQVVEDYSCNNCGGLMLVWRRDARRKWARGLSVHDSEEAAMAAMKWFADQWEPPSDEMAKASYDRQQQRFYKWESRIEKAFPVCKESLSLAECETLAEQASRPHHPPKVVFSDKLQRRCYYAGGVVNLAAWGRTRGTLLHETAHHIARCERKIGTKDDVHGPRFVGVFMRLLHVHLGIPYDVMIAEAQKGCIDYEITT